MSPRVPVTRDIAFFFEGTRRHELLLRSCAACGRLQHPPEPMCPSCHGLEWDERASTGTGTVYSYVVTHEPRRAGFEYPLVVALIDLDDGVRFVSNIVGVEPADVSIGMRVQVEYEDLDEELTVPRFRPVSP